MSSHLAIDLGAGSGRVTRGVLDKDRLSIEEVHRFPNEMVFVEGHHRWDTTALFEHILKGLKIASERGGAESLGIDSWGVDFVLLDEEGHLVNMPVAYRDARTDGMMERFFDRVPADEIYRRTGIQFAQFNTIYQLFALVEENSPTLRKARSLLMIPDYFNYLLSGRKTAEHTEASTTQLVNVENKDWDKELIRALGVNPGLFQEILFPGTTIGVLTPEMEAATGLRNVSVVLPATHDTGSAVAAVPAEGADWAYISSGTWSLMGVERDNPVVTQQSRRTNFTNEGGVNGTYRFLKNIMGLWLIIKLKEELGPSDTFEDMVEQAMTAGAFGCIIDANDSRFLSPESMKDAIAAYCKESDQAVPSGAGEYYRCALEALALQYAEVLDDLRAMHDRPINRIHIVGGGCRNTFLCRMAADATSLPVLAGPVEGTAIGNILVQALFAGTFQSLEEARHCVRRSFDVVQYEPRDAAIWDDAKERYLKIKERMNV